MDPVDINDLIIAGELIIQKRKNESSSEGAAAFHPSSNCGSNDYFRNSNECQSSSFKMRDTISSGFCNSSESISSDSILEKTECEFQHDCTIGRLSERRSLSNGSGSVSDSSKPSLSGFDSKSETTVSNSERKGSETQSHTKSNATIESREASSTELFSLTHIQSLREECAIIFSLSQSMASSLLNANRILSQMIKDQSTKGLSVEERLLEEVSSCNGSCKENEAHMRTSATKIHDLLSQLSESYYESRELKNIVTTFRSQCLILLDLIADLLARNNLAHLIPDSKRNQLSALRLLEEVNLGLTLLSGELPSLVLQEQVAQLEEARNYQLKLEEKVESLETELRKSCDEKRKCLSSIEVERNETLRDLEEAKQEIINLQSQKKDLDFDFNKQRVDSERKRTQLMEEVLKFKQLYSEMKMSSLKEKEQHDLVRIKLEDEITSLRSKLRSAEEHEHDFMKANEKLQKELESKQSKLKSEKEGFGGKLLKVELEKQVYVDKAKALEDDLGKEKLRIEVLKKEVLTMEEKIQSKEEEFMSDLQTLEKKIDEKNEELCEKSSELRSMEVKVMEMKTELDLERQRSSTLGAEIDILTKQFDRLQEKMRKLARHCPRDIRIACGLAGLQGRTDDYVDVQLGQALEESQAREEELKKLLLEKDEEMKGLHQSLTEEILKKNEELERLSTSVQSLEDEMSLVSSSMNLSSDLFVASQKTASYLNSRSKHIQVLQNQVKNLSLECRCRSCEENIETMQSLKSQLGEAKKHMRAAREEARKERIQAAKLQQQLAMMQIDLDSAKARTDSRLEQNPMERVIPLSSDFTINSRRNSVDDRSQMDEES